MTSSYEKILSDDVIYPIGVGDQGIKPQYIIYREIDYDAGSGKFYFIKRDVIVKWEKLKLKGLKNIEDLLTHISMYEGWGMPQIDIKGSDIKELDIDVNYPSHIIVAISKKLPWFFNANTHRAAITLGGSSSIKYLDNFGKLIHYNGDDTISSNFTYECKLVAFSVAPLSNPTPPAKENNTQSINFHLVDSAGTPITVDPDIRYPGNTGLAEGDPPVPLPAGEGEKQDA